eukprot:Pgem_evm1s8385
MYTTPLTNDMIVSVFFAIIQEVKGLIRENILLEFEKVKFERQQKLNSNLKNLGLVGENEKDDADKDKD